MFVATAFVAVACAVVRYAATAGDVLGWVFAIAAIPILLGAAIGTLAGRVGFGTRIGVGVAVGLGLLAVLVLIVAATLYYSFFRPPP